MKLTIVLTCVGLLAMAAAPAGAQEPAAYTDPIYGFSVAVPRLGTAAGGPVLQRLMVFGPAQDGFSPNCNVQVQRVEMTLETFMNLTEQQLVAADLQLLARSALTVSGRPAETIEYSGLMSGQQLRWLALAVEGGDRFWVLTCTGRASGFEDLRADFDSVIESFRIVGSLGEK